MHEDSKRWFKLAAGEEWSSRMRTPTGMESVEAALKQAWSHYPLRNLGWASDGEVLLAEEDRESHIHILGAPGEGKSKLLELLIRQDIDQGYGCCLLDPSDNGDTAYKVLKYCLKKGHTKVLLIDPHDFPDHIPIINPIHYGAPGNVSAQHLMDTFRVLWGDKSHEATPNINRYLPGILRALHASGKTLHEAVYFADQTHPEYKYRRNSILARLHPLDKDRVTLESIFANSSKSLFNLEFGSTVRRLNPFFDDVMKLIVGSNHNPINFMDMISKGWVILVNLDPQGVWGTEQQRLLGTLIINEIIYAIHRLQNGGWRGVYYLYIDEVGDYATPKLAYVLDKKRKTGLRFTVAHQRFDQIEDANVLSAVKGSTKIKVLFNTQSRKDRDEMMRNMGYGGDLSDRSISYELSQLTKQYAAIKINKNPPRITRIPDLPDIKVSSQELQDFKERLYRQPWYRSRTEILSEINARFTKPESTPTKERPFDNEPVEPARGNRRQGENTRRTDTRDRRAVPDHKADSEVVLSDKKRRNTRNRQDSESEGD